MANLHDIVEGIQDALGNLTPTPVVLQEESTAYDLKKRLEWGEPALSIIDIREHEAFNQGRITGAVSMPMEQLDQMKSTLQPEHDIYIYAESDDRAHEAAQMLRAAGFEAVTHIMGGLDAWHEIGGPTEGVQEDASPPTADAFNVISRLKEDHDTKVAGKAQHANDD
ncbi:rhodanese-like domain-containing protein [Chamaesiphon sp. OTE_20_metabat_361]|uniref:rhodanese-like domain-containing protein n=1 Tax=Chamaesiphon sp. OTE_20_metabat_361 TaxID=2964689 RepID=UPI00286B54A5|nr:rhodanese-like domain-containing protein [Chamaesiphon sp. OTE_20_metabat_361]